MGAQDRGMSNEAASPPDTLAHLGSGRNRTRILRVRGKEHSRSRLNRKSSAHGGWIISSSLAWSSAQLIAHLLLTPVVTHRQFTWAEPGMALNLTANWDEEVDTSVDCVQERQWVEFCHNSPIIIDSDASSTGLGALTFEGGQKATLSLQGTGEYINREELLAVIDAIEALEEKDTLRRVRMRIDNTSSAS
eukprot:gene22394-8907_t